MYYVTRDISIYYQNFIVDMVLWELITTIISKNNKSFLKPCAVVTMTEKCFSFPVNWVFSV